MRPLTLTSWLAGSLLVVLGVLVPGSSAAAQSQVATPAAGAVQRFGACLTQQKAGDLLLLLDQSGSLQDTDPSDARVTAASYLLSQLSRTSEQIGADLQVAVAGFDRDYQRTVPWQRLTSDSLPDMLQGVRAYAERDAGFDTDYVNAVVGANAELRSRQRDPAQERCQVLVWFSDGQFDLEVRDTDAEAERYGTTKGYARGADLRTRRGRDAATDQGRAALCRNGGLADQLRAGGTLTFAVGLGEQAEYDLMRSIATGSASGAAGCGAAPHQPVGEFVLAKGVEDLAFALNMVAGVVPVEETITGVCQRTACTTEARRFVLDASISNVDVLAGTTQPGIDVYLTSPAGGAPAVFSFDRVGPVPPQRVGGQEVSGAWLSDKQLELDLDRVGAGWDGQWSLVFVDPAGASRDARARTQIRITGDLAPRLAEPTEDLPAIEDSRLVLGVESDETKRPVGPETIRGTVGMSGALLTRDGRERPLFTDRTLADVSAGIGVDLSALPPGPAMLRLTLDVTTQGTTVAGRAVPGTALEPRRADVPVTLVAPGLPSTASRVDFGRGEGPGPHAATLAVNGPGCVWLAGTSVETFPEGVTVDVTAPASSPEDCLELQEGERRELPLSLVLDEAGNGTVSGVLEVKLARTGATSDAVSASVPFVGDVQRPADPEVFRWVFVLSVVFGLGLPLAFLYLVKHATAKIPGKGLRAGSVDLTVSGREVRRDGLPLTLSLADTRFVGIPPRGVRTLEVEGVRLRTRVGRSPAAPAHTQVLAPGQLIITGQGNDRLPLAVHGNWVALVAPDLTSARLILLLPHDATDVTFERVTREVRDRLPVQLAQRREAAGRPPSTGSRADGGWGAPTAPSRAASGPGPGGPGDFTPPPPPSSVPPPSAGWGAPPSRPSRGFGTSSS